MGGFHRAGTGKNNGLFQILFLLLVTKILKNCL